MKGRKVNLSYRIISIGTLSRNRFWNETAPKRSAHATCTLIQDDDIRILVDPALPESLLLHYLDERAGIKPEAIDLVFLTTFRPAHRRGLALFERATWRMHEAEIAAVGHHLAEMAERLSNDEDTDTPRILEQERAILERIDPAEDKLTRRVDLFPSPGVSPGSAGLLLTLPQRTVIVAGDAVATHEYYAAGRVYEQAAEVERAARSFAEIVEIADEIVPGHDNVFHTGTS
ncbi:MAG: MBL fold metallo-hydrolase [Phycisphaerales bacterium]|nr:MBL fold metallo-hydrolase [Phycisphaerales bacterium]